MLKKSKRAAPEIGKVSLFSSAHLRYVFTSGYFLESRTPALLSPLSPEEGSNLLLSDFGCKGTTNF